MELEASSGYLGREGQSHSPRGSSTGHAPRHPSGYHEGDFSAVQASEGSIKLEVESAQLVEQSGHVAANRHVYQRAIVVALLFTMALALSAAALACDLWLQNNDANSYVFGTVYLPHATAILTMVSSGYTSLCLSHEASLFSANSTFYMPEAGCTEDRGTITQFYLSLQSPHSFDIPAAINGVGALSILYVTTLALALATSMCMYWVLYTGGKQWKFCALAIATAALMALAVAAAVSVLGVWGEVSAIGRKELKDAGADQRSLWGVSYWLLLVSAMLVVAAGFAMTLMR
mmetsp:Transcript_27381/g.70365  ORF Transcript_27381/g.70365 Transcript_27381/m.70365 type:complete len:289 (-) Transcript_27381:1004-1870(-)|eukprot:jgi/Tetstr1/449758/TSEL_036824.t1